MTSHVQTDIARIEVAVVTDADMIAAQANRIAELEAALREAEAFILSTSRIAPTFGNVLYAVRAIRAVLAKASS